LTRQFSKEEMKMVNKYMRKCSTFLAPKEIKSHKIAREDAVE
jgi:hypothetical protein